MAVRLRPLSAREVAQGETEAVTVSHEDPHSLEVRAVHSRMLRQQPFAFSARSPFEVAVHKSGLPVQVAWDNIACLIKALALNSSVSRILSHSHRYNVARCEHQGRIKGLGNGPDTPLKLLVHVQVLLPGPKGTPPAMRSFAFHACLGPATKQADVLRVCGLTQLLDAALAGFHVTIMTYGQTGSGKTFTMSGREERLEMDDYIGESLHTRLSQIWHSRQLPS